MRKGCFKVGASVKACNSELQFLASVHDSVCVCVCVGVRYWVMESERYLF